jgi:hypothetical protein
MDGLGKVSRRRFLAFALGRNSSQEALSPTSEQIEPYQGEIDNLIEIYSDFLGLDPLVINPGVTITRDRLWPSYEYSTSTIHLSRYDKPGGDIESFRHEFRHHVQSQVLRHVIEENPSRFMAYLDDFYPSVESYGISFLTFLRSKSLNDRIKRIEALDRSDSSQLERSLDDLHGLYYEAMDQRHDLREAFADNSDRTSRYFNNINTALWILSCFGTSIGILNIWTAKKLETKTLKRRMLFSLGLSNIVAGITLGSTQLYPGVFQKYSLRSDEPLTTETLSRFPTGDRKYLIALLPNRGTSIETHLKSLKQYGFPISYGS